MSAHERPVIATRDRGRPSVLLSRCDFLRGAWRGEPEPEIPHVRALVRELREDEPDDEQE